MEQSSPVLDEVTIASSEDDELQPCLCFAPKLGGTAPLLVMLHQWSQGYRMTDTTWAEAAHARGWAYMQPDFRGPNRRPEACGSPLAQRDILDAADWSIANLGADPARIYLAGVSGGGHMTLLMAGTHPERFAAASAWVGISDVAVWHREHVVDGVADKYAKNIVACAGGEPGSSAAVDRSLFERSPINFLANARNLPLDIAAGVQDGHTGSVRIHHSLDAFNVVAITNGDAPITSMEIDQLQRERRLTKPTPQDVAPDPDFAGRAIYLRRTSGKARVTIFEGGHEGIADAACRFLSRYSASGGNG